MTGQAPSPVGHPRARAGRATSDRSTRPNDATSTGGTRTERDLRASGDNGRFAIALDHLWRLKDGYPFEGPVSIVADDSE